MSIIKSMDKDTIKAKIIQVMQAELRRQYTSGELGWYAEFADYVAVDGNPDLGKLADSILEAMKQPGDMPEEN